MIIKSFVNYLKYSKAKYKNTVAMLIISAIVFLILWLLIYIFFDVVVEVNILWMLFWLSIVFGRLIVMYMAEKHSINIDNPKIHPFIRLFSFVSTLLIGCILLVLTIQYIDENHSVSDRIKETNKPAYKVSEKNETNTTIKSMYQPSFPTVQLHQPLKE